jgi:hypothetical protein
VVQVIEGRERSGVLEKSGNYHNDMLGLMMSPKKQDIHLTKEING